VETELILNNSGISASRIVQIEGLDKKIAAMNAQKTQEAAAIIPTSEEIEVVIAEPTVQLAPVIEELVTVEEESQLQQLLSQPWLWLGALGLLAVLVFFLSRRKQKPVVFHCARCGYKMAEGVNTCPECGETRKM